MALHAWKVGIGWLSSRRVVGALQLPGMVLGTLVLVGMLLWLVGQNPVTAYVEIFKGSLGSVYGLTEILVKMSPLLLCALATALPGHIGLINVGAEGQFHVGALAATWGAMTFSGAPAVVLLPWVTLLGFAGGALYGLLCGVLRTAGGVNETISSLLLNYVAILLVEYLVHGPWRDPTYFNWPYSPAFPEAAILPSFGSTRIHGGLVFGVVAAILMFVVLRKTRWGYEMRVLGDNPEAARLAGIPTTRYIVLSLALGGGVAGLAGMAEVSAIHGRLQPSISANYGYVGFLVSWLANHHPLGIFASSFLLGVLSLGGDIVQISLRLPSSAVQVLMALIFLVVLSRTYLRAPRGG
jgi:simple sugar transport system permease protein